MAYVRLAARYECWTISYHRAGLRILKGPVSLSTELRDSQIAHVRDLYISQALLASVYDKLKRRERFYALMLAFRIPILPRKVRGIISGLLNRANQTWNVVALSQELGRKTVDRGPASWRHVKQYQIVLRGT
jgi:hypothetical protein